MLKDKSITDDTYSNAAFVIKFSGLRTTIGSDDHNALQNIIIPRLEKLVSLSKNLTSRWNSHRFLRHDDFFNDVLWKSVLQKLNDANEHDELKHVKKMQLMFALSEWSPSVPSGPWYGEAINGPIAFNPQFKVIADNPFGRGARWRDHQITRADRASIFNEFRAKIAATEKDGGRLFWTMEEVHLRLLLRSSFTCDTTGERFDLCNSRLLVVPDTVDGDIGCQWRPNVMNRVLTFLMEHTSIFESQTLNHEKAFLRQRKAGITTGVDSAAAILINAVISPPRHHDARVKQFMQFLYFRHEGGSHSDPIETPAIGTKQLVEFSKKLGDRIFHYRFLHYIRWMWHAKQETVEDKFKDVKLCLNGLGTS